MKKWLFFLTHAIEASIVLAAVYFEPTYCVRGVLRGEEFYNGRPASYWAAELERWEVNPLHIFFFSGDPKDLRLMPCFHREPSWFEELQRRISGGTDRS